MTLDKSKILITSFEIVLVTLLILTFYQVGGFHNNLVSSEVEIKSPSGITSNWWNSSWQYRRKLFFNNSGQGALNNFTALIKLTLDNFNYSKAKSDGSDLRFVDNDGTTELNYHIEKWNDANNESFIWVKIPHIPAYSETDYVWLYYGNPLATDGQNEAGSYDGNYKGVWHLNKNQSGEINASDFTSNNNDGNVLGATLNKSGKIDGAGDFDGVDDYVSIPISSSLDFSSKTKITVAVWIYRKGNSGGACCGQIAGQRDVNGYDLRYDNRDTGAELEFIMGQGSWAGDSSAFGIPIPLSEWHFIVAVADGTNLLLYDNAELKDTYSYSGIVGVNGETKIGGAGDGYFNGLIDEVRISNVSRSSSWIKASYLSESDKFITFGLEYNYANYDGDIPGIKFVNPTDPDGKYFARNFTFVNVSVSDLSSNTSSFINWNHSLVGYWNFNEGIGGVAEDISGYGNNGTIYGASWTYGKFGEALSFDGVGDYVNVSSSNVFSSDIGNGSFTVEIWVKSIDLNNSGFITNYHGTLGNWAWGIKTYPHDYLQFLIFNTTKSEAIGFIYSDIEDGNWHQIVAVRNSFSNCILSLYKDGVLGNSGTGHCYTLSETKNLLIGSPYGNFYFNGSIDEVRIWNRALTPGEIKASYNSGLYRLYRNFTNLPDGTYEYYAYVTDEEGNVNQTEVRNVTIDTIKPTITFTKPLYDNSTLVAKWFKQNITVSDVNLYWLNCTIYNSTGGVYWSKELNLSGLQNYDINDIVDISSWSLGLYYENCTVMDLTER